ncbi:MAG TPA: hypothetical protein VGZ90_16015 [Puia sp.]|jgi:hypothetical protein|nr:hypothetical protein [Puia sp.]
MNGMPGWKNKPFWIRLLHWEYWRFHVIYMPIYPIFILLCLRARSFFFYAAANPKIKNGGFLGESKKEIYELVPGALQPRTIFFSKGSDPGSVLERLVHDGFHFPLIGKPDIGGRGRGIKKLDDATSVMEYASAVPFNFHIQEFILYENEAGIFYYRFPDQNKGNISGIVHKEFLKVRGDGFHSIRDLLKTNPRAILQIPQLEIDEPEMLHSVLPAGEIFTVSPYGNHARGALFLDDSRSVNEALVKLMDEICQQIPEFYFGRLDIRYESRELLDQGKSFSILEVNGAGSEPTHIYDPSHSIFFAWKEIIRHWILLLRISLANHQRGHSYLSVSEGLQMFKKDKLDSALLSSLQNKSG